MEVQGFPNYLIYEDGKIRSHRFPNRFLKPCLTKDGYLHTRLYHNKKGKTELIHQLVAKTYIPNPHNLPTVDHIDRDKTNNHVSNLRWATRKEQTENRNILYNPIMNIRYRKDRNSWYIRTSKVHKTFKTKKEAICYKYIHNLRIRAGHYQ